MNFLNELALLSPVSRVIYGSDENDKPNDHCNWDNYFGHWKENDEHFRNRIKKAINKNET